MIEYKRKYSIVHVTDLGLYHQNKLPANYTGAVLDIEVVHRILFLHSTTGELMSMTFLAPEAKNSGGGNSPYPPGEVRLRVATVNENFADGVHYFPQSLKNKGDFFIAAEEANGGVVI